MKRMNHHHHPTHLKSVEPTQTYFLVARYLYSIDIIILLLILLILCSSKKKKKKKKKKKNNNNTTTRGDRSFILGGHMWQLLYVIYIS